MQLRARIPGNYHLHPLLNVRDVGTLVGKGAWVRVEDIDEPVTFVNEVETMQGEVIDLETYGVENCKKYGTPYG